MNSERRVAGAVRQPLSARFRGYVEVTRSPRYSLLFALPLLVAYETLAAALSWEGAGVRNGADVLIKSLFRSFLGPDGGLFFGVLLIVGCGVLFARDLRKHKGDLHFRVLGFMLLESAVLAALFGLVVGTITANLLQPFRGLVLAPQDLDGVTHLMVSLGAGLYEELLFRVLLVGLLTLVFTRLLGLARGASAVGAVLISAVIFSSFHYIGALGDHFTVASFVFRLVAGIFFSALYVVRGFGVTAWTHALYDIYLL